MTQNGITPLEDRSVFPLYKSQKDYTDATGKPCPTFNPAFPIKNWEDPDAAKLSPYRSVKYSMPATTWETQKALLGPDGKPHLEDVYLQSAQAAVVNIQPDDHEYNGQTIQMPFPLKPFGTTEELHLQFGGVIVIADITVVDETGGSFTSADRITLNAIAKKIGA